MNCLRGMWRWVRYQAIAMYRDYRDHWLDAQW
jgi:hypothetical protein